MGQARGSRGADMLAASLSRAGVRRVFSLSGNHIMALYDALLDVDIPIVHVRHEGAAVHMADAWARLTGEVGVALLTGGPGHANGVSALYTAGASESPVVYASRRAGNERPLALGVRGTGRRCCRPPARWCPPDHRRRAGSRAWICRVLMQQCKKTNRHWTKP